jgi:hypothetical protein
MYHSTRVDSSENVETLPDAFAASLEIQCCGTSATWRNPALPCWVCAKGTSAMTGFSRVVGILSSVLWFPGREPSPLGARQMSCASLRLANHVLTKTEVFLVVASDILELEIFCPALLKLCAQLRQLVFFRRLPLLPGFTGPVILMDSGNSAI